MPMQNQKIIDYINLVLPNLNHCVALKIDLLDACSGDVKLRLPYSDWIIGNIESGVINGGAITTLMDTTCAFAAISALGEPTIAPTLDLRIDYMRAAEPNTDIIGHAEAYRVTRHVIFARGQAYHQGQFDNPIAFCTATFMRLDATTTQGDTQKVIQQAE